MKWSLFINKEKEEEILIYAHEENDLVKDIISLVALQDKTINGIYNDEIQLITPSLVSCFISENNKVYALINDKKYLIKKRLYQIEEMMDESFLKINQSCLVNRKKIVKFQASIGGSLMVILDNGYKDYVARRELKNIKQRMGL
ncbi:LytTr DNA-binding domain-containing protein [Anaeroplasma bactoclasticum]|uniref:LytTr DNA-binding domain-containing protein n=1 Tax=Anaeroplasma bactoclasticum TaxID=2088 RepID=A0A397RVH8_9MOLU|nr:LytTR family DNA-binding domain-containing protein [Anaeroplasma bactoclasticum]RIA77718.1 LytTr DNA-binding domain-containing protein [Anaeroplasma bactoclasticum]